MRAPDPEPGIDFPVDPHWKAGARPIFAEAFEALAGRHVAVTRALSVMGRSQAAMLNAAGARVTLLDVPALVNEGIDLARDLRTSRFLPVDFNVATEAQSAASLLAAEDPVDVLVNNVAPEIKLPFRQLSVEDFEMQIHNTCTATMVTSRAIATGMKTRGRGSIVNLCAVTHHGEWSGYVSYAASNGAIIGLTRSLARELGEHGIRVNSISLGAVASRAEIRIFGDRLGDYDAWVVRNQCLKRRIRPEDVADLVMFLASDRSSMITGQNLVIDGGW